MDVPMLTPPAMKSPNIFHAESVFVGTQSGIQPLPQEGRSVDNQVSEVRDGRSTFGEDHSSPPKINKPDPRSAIAFSFCGQDDWVEKPPVSQLQQDFDRKDTPGFNMNVIEPPALSVLRGHLFEEYNEFKVPSDFNLAKLHRVSLAIY